MGRVTRIMTLFADQSDYIYFVYGLAFFCAALLCFPLVRRQTLNLPWGWLATFAVVHGIHEWVILLALSFGMNPTIAVLYEISLVTSFMMLFEFGRQCWNQSRGETLPRVTPGITILLFAVLLIAAPYGVAGATSRYLFALPGGVLGGMALWCSARAHPELSRFLRTAGFGLGLYGLTSILKGEPAEWFPVYDIYQRFIEDRLRLPLEIVRGTLILMTGIGLHRLHIHVEFTLHHHDGNSSATHNARRLFALLGVTTVFGWFLTEALGQFEIKNQNKRMIEQAHLVANLLDQGAVADLTGRREDLGTSAYATLKENLTRSAAVSDNINSIYLYTLRDETFVFFVGSSSDEPHTNVEPGDVYEGETAATTYDFFTTGIPYVKGPFTDRWGRWVSAAVPVLWDLDTGRVMIALGLDMEAEDFLARIRLFRFGGIFVTALMCFIIMDYFSQHRRIWRDTMSLAYAAASTRKLNQELEARVAQRTRELDLKNQSLHQEMIQHQAAETAARDAEARYRTLTEQLPAITYTVNLQPSPRTVYVSPQLEEIFGYSPQEWLDDPDLWKNVIDPEDRDPVIEEVAYCNRTSEPFDLMYRARTRQGKTIWIRNIARYLRDFHGVSASVHGVMFDITYEQETNMTLREADELNRLLFEQSPVGTFNYTPDLIITQCNPAFARILKVSIDHLTGLDMNKLKDKRILPCLLAPMTGKPGLYEGPYHSTLAEASLYLRIKTNPLYDSDGESRGAVAIVEDLTAERRVEEEQIKTQKLESLGLLAGGIAHDFNNILTAILGNLSLIRVFTPPQNDKAIELLNEAEQASIRARDLTQQLLTFAKGGTPIKRTHHLSAIVEDVVSFALRGSRCSHSFTGCEFEPLVDLDAGQIGQAIQNLIINADEAMPDGGVITLTLSRVAVEAATGPDLAPGDYMRLDVTDHGVGIAEEIAMRIFEPYYSTKQRGSGLGLTTAHAILRKHGGDISLCSVPGKGSSFSLYIPVAQDVWAEVDEAAPVKTASTLGNQERILVMDDEPMVAQLATKILEHNNYRVTRTADGREAIRAYQQAIDEGDPFALVILDLTVPGGMGGDEAFKELRVIDPDVKAIVSSGYSTGDIMAHYEDHGYVATIPKPYSAKDLIQTVSNCIRG